MMRRTGSCQKAEMSHGRQRGSSRAVQSASGRRHGDRRFGKNVIDAGRSRSMCEGGEMVDPEVMFALTLAAVVLVSGWIVRIVSGGDD